MGEAVVASFPNFFEIDFTTAVRKFRDLLKEHADESTLDGYVLQQRPDGAHLSVDGVAVFFEQVSEIPNCCGPIYVETLREISENCLTRRRFAINYEHKMKATAVSLVDADRVFRRPM